MYIVNYPEDSTLRRHYESAAAFKRAARLREPPTDSVLRRHYQQLNQASPAPAAKVAPTAKAAPTAASTRPQSSPQSSGDSPAPANGGGFLGWLKRLFG